MNRYGREQFLDQLLPSLRRVGTGGTMGQIDQSDHGDRDIGIPALPEMAASIWRAFCPSRSAVISTLESRIGPMRAVRAARDDFRKLPPHPWRSQRRWSPSSLQLATRCTPRWTGAAVSVHGSPPRAACHSRSRLPHPRSPVPAAQRSRWRLPLPMWITWSATQRLCRYYPCSDSASKAASSSVWSWLSPSCAPHSVIPVYAPDAAAVAEACAPWARKPQGM